MPETTRGAAPERVAPVTLGTSILGGIGNTPLLRIRLFERECPGVAVFGKAEFLNAGGSVKDRAALRMIRDGEASGALTPGRIILDSTSGNTGIAYAMVGAALGYRVRLVMPTNVSDERKTMIAAYGAEIVYSDAQEGSDGAIVLAQRIFAEDPDRYFMPDQYNNPANWQAHYDGTGAEIWRQTDGNRDALRRRAGHQRHVHGGVPAVACRTTGHGVHLRAAGGSVARPGGDEAHAHRDRAGHLRPDPGQRQPLGADRGVVRPRPRACADRGHHGRPLQRGRAVGCARDGAAGRAWCHRHRALRRRQQVPQLRALRRARGMTLGEVVLAAGADASIRSLAVAAYPNEGCGVLIGRFVGPRVEVVDATSGTNTNTERARDRYLLDPADIVRADRDARERGLDIVGFWHSHPDHPARPSQFDTDHAWVDYVYVIVNTTADGAGDLNGFTLAAEGGPFEQLALVVTPAGEPRQ